MLYKTFLGSGLRVTELRLLEWRDLDLEGEEPVFKIRAETTKSRRYHTHAIPRYLARELKEYKPANISPKDKVFYRAVPEVETLKR